MLANSLPSFKSLAHSCLQLSVKDPLKANANYRNHCSINGNPLYSMRQLSKPAVTISHYAHTVIAKNLKKSYTILGGLTSFLQIFTWINRSAYEI